MNKPVNNISVTLSDAIPPKDIGPFSFTTSGAPANSFPGAVRLSSQKQQVLVVDFELLNDRYLEQNTYTHDNSAMWNQEVFEVFISAGAETPMRYLEIELNPNGALFSAWVTNPDGTGRNNVVDFFAGRNAGIQTSVVKGENFWHGKIIIPLSLLGSLQEHYRLNFFRIVSLQPHDPESSWSCTAESCAFLAWSPTFSGDVPNFHIPACFGHLNLK